MNKSRRFVFTINNPTDDEEQTVCDFLDSDVVTYGIFGRERGAEGTPHLQGFLVLPSPQRFSYLHARLCARAHLEVAKAKSQVAADYCKKEGDFEEFGTLPDHQGRRSDIDEFKIWITSLSHRPSEREVATAYPSLYLRYRGNLMQLVGHLSPAPSFGLGDELYQWQRELRDILVDEPDDRSINFVVDHDGANGKTYFVRWCLQQYPDQVQCLSIGKRDDLAHSIDETKRIFFFDIPRRSMEYLQYTVLEKLKDQLIFSGKYESTTKVLPHPVHVVVMCNEDPDITAMTFDRYKFIEIKI